MTKRKNRSYSDEFKKEALALVTEQGYSVSEAATSLCITAKLLYNWKAKFEQEQLGVGLDEDDRSELKRLRKEVKTSVISSGLTIEVETNTKNAQRTVSDHSGRASRASGINKKSALIQ